MQVFMAVFNLYSKEHYNETNKTRRNSVNKANSEFRWIAADAQSFLAEKVLWSRRFWHAYYFKMQLLRVFAGQIIKIYKSEGFSSTLAGRIK